MNFGGSRKAWKDIWGSGQGIGVIKEVVPARRMRLAAPAHRVMSRPCNGLAERNAIARAPLRSRASTALPRLSEQPITQQDIHERYMFRSSEVSTSTSRFAVKSDGSGDDNRERQEKTKSRKKNEH
jgi:hypothetical protein